MFTILIPTLFGLEAAVRDECLAAGFAPARIAAADGQVDIFSDSPEEARQAVARLNLRLRCGERVLLELARFPAADFDQLFDGARQIPWEDFLDAGLAIHIKAYSRKSQLTALPSIQRVLKKAIVERLQKARGLAAEDHLPEDPRLGTLQLHAALVDDQLSLALDSSGEPLHKRGYRPAGSAAPLRETLAAAMLHYSFYERERAHDEVLLDPFCGSGTILIEAALIARHQAPGLARSFAGEKLQILGKELFAEEREAARAEIVSLPSDALAFGQDIDGKVLHLAAANARRAGVADWLRFRRADIERAALPDCYQWTGHERLLLVTNPPYGERLGDPAEALHLLRVLGRLALPRGQRAKGLRLSLISPLRQSEAALGLRADKKRKLYNGGIRCTFLHYFR